MEALNIKEEQVTKDLVVLSMPVGPKTHQPFGMLHGGASVVLAETAASIGALLNVNTRKEIPVGLEINANHIKGKANGTVFAHATPVHIGKSTMVWEIKIKDEEEQLICISRCTISIKKVK
jgi:1,4-dihydroxy-2-naphthoyl-CoA hydrolase